MEINKKIVTLKILTKVLRSRLRFDLSKHDPHLGSAIGDYIVACQLRDIAKLFSNKQLSADLEHVAMSMTMNASKGLLKGLQDGDDICPPWPPFPFPGPRPWWKQDFLFDGDPDGSPAVIAQFSPSMELLMIAGALKQLAALSSNKTFCNQIFGIGMQLAKEASLVVYDEFCENHPQPRFSEKEILV